MLMLTILIAAQIAQAQIAQPPVAKVASPDAATKLQPLPKAAFGRPQSKERTLSQGRALLARAEAHPGASADATSDELEARIGELKSDLDSLSEMSEADSLQMQIHMDRIAKQMSALSNMMKKASDTQSAIIQNIK